MRSSLVIDVMEARSSAFVGRFMENGGIPTRLERLPDVCSTVEKDTLADSDGYQPVDREFEYGR